VLPYRVLGYRPDLFAWEVLGEAKTEKEGITLTLARRAAQTHIWVTLARLSDLFVRVVLTTAPHPERLPTLPEFRSVAWQDLPQPAEVGDAR